MRRLWTIPAALALAAVYVGVTHAQGGTPPPTPPVTPPVTPTTGTVDVMAALAPVLAASTAVERTLEATFNFIEVTLLKLIGRFAMGTDWLEWAVLEIDSANRAIRSASSDLKKVVAEEGRVSAQDAEAVANLAGQKEALIRQLNQAEAWLLDSEKRLQDVVKSPGYLRIKQVMALSLGVLIGLVIAFIGQIDILNRLGLVNTHPVVGNLLTGLIVGAGSGPVHSLIGLLQQTMNTVDQLRGYLGGKALNEAAQALSTAQSTSAVGGASRGLEETPTIPPQPITPRQLRSLRRLID